MTVLDAEDLVSLVTSMREGGKEEKTSQGGRLTATVPEDEGAADFARARVLERIGVHGMVGDMNPCAPWG